MAAATPTTSGRHLARALIVAITLFATVGTASARLPVFVAPAWQLQSLDGGQVRFPEALDGRPAIIFLWATWCPYCRQMMPFIEAMRLDYADLGLQVFAVNVWQGPGDTPVAAAIEREGVDFVVLLDGDAVAEAYGMIGTPGLYVVDERGVVIWDRTNVLGASAEDLSHRERAAIAAPLWADQMREVLDGFRP
jgi:thiol-disulfide isomerase/thioredoxin